MKDALILEDSSTIMAVLSHRIRSDCKYTWVKNTAEFRKCLSDGYSARFYFLDDNVPDENGVLDRRFISNCDFLLGCHPDAKVFYTSDTPRPQEEAYCADKNISIIKKEEIPRLLREPEQLHF